MKEFKDEIRAMTRESHQLETQGKAAVSDGRRAYQDLHFQNPNRSRAFREEFEAGISASRIRDLEKEVKQSPSSSTRRSLKREILRRKDSLNEHEMKARTAHKNAKRRRELPETIFEREEEIAENAISAGKADLKKAARVDKRVNKIATKLEATKLEARFVRPAPPPASRPVYGMPSAYPRSYSHSQARQRNTMDGIGQPPPRSFSVPYVQPERIPPLYKPAPTFIPPNTPGYVVKIHDLTRQGKPDIVCFLGDFKIDHDKRIRYQEDASGNVIITGFDLETRQEICTPLVQLSSRGHIIRVPASKLWEQGQPVQSFSRYS